MLGSSHRSLRNGVRTTDGAGVVGHRVSVAVKTLTGWDGNPDSRMTKEGSHNYSWGE